MNVANKKMSILIVDDKSNMRRTIKNLLRRIGYERVVEADDGDTALSRLRSGDIDLILCDWNMPRMSGLEVLRAIRDDDDLKDLPFIMVTAEMEEATVAEAGEIDVDAYILKPFTPELIQSKIEAVMEARKTPSPIEVLLNLGQVHLKSRQYHEALAEFQKALKINPRSPRVLLAIGQVLEAQENQDKALDFYTQALKLSPQFLRAHEALAKLYQNKGDLKAATKHLKAAAAISPRNVERQVKLGRNLIALGQKEEAKQVFNQALKMATDNIAEVARQVGEVYLEAGLEALAQEIFLQGLASSPEDIQLFNRLGIAFRKQQKFREAIDNYQQALKIDPENENLYYNLGRAYYEAGDPDKAEMAMRRALKLYAEFEEARTFIEKVLQKQV